MTGFKDEKTPVECRLDRSRLGSIEVKLEQIVSKIDHLGSLEGPIGSLKSEMVKNQERVNAAHRRLDTHDVVLEDIGKKQWAMAVKVATTIGGSAGLLYVLRVFIER